MFLLASQYYFREYPAIQARVETAGAIVIPVILRPCGWSDVSPLAGLIALQRLDLMNTRVSDVSPLAGLTAPQRLDLRRTQVRNVSPLRHLTQLKIVR